MPTIRLETFINIPLQVCFDLARDVDVHARTTAWTKERAVAPGVTSGLMGAGDLVTFEAVHFGIKQKLTARMTEFDPPHRFADDMTKGAFRSLRHVHEFEAKEGGTLMRDTLIFTSPLGILGVIADRLFLERYMRGFVMRRNRNLKTIAEAGGV